MSSDDKKAKTSPAVKKDGPPNDKNGSGVNTSKAEGNKAERSKTAEGSKAEGSKGEGSKAEGSKAEGSKAEGSKAEGSKAEGSKAEGSKIADAVPSGYSRGEGQKPVTKAYKDNWNAIFAKKNKKR